jgi:hypothetical protein
MEESELISRIENLERSNRRLKRLGISVMALVAGLVTIAATRPVPDKIVAHEFEAVDAHGTPRVIVSAVHDPIVSITGEAGVAEVEMQYSKSVGPGFFLGPHEQAGRIIADVQITVSIPKALLPRYRFTGPRRRNW